MHLANIGVKVTTVSSLRSVKGNSRASNAVISTLKTLLGTRSRMPSQQSPKETTQTTILTDSLVDATSGGMTKSQAEAIGSGGFVETVIEPSTADQPEPSAVAPSDTDDGGKAMRLNNLEAKSARRLQCLYQEGRYRFLSSKSKK